MDKPNPIKPLPTLGKRRQGTAPFIIGALAVLFALAGIILIIVSLSGGGSPISLFATRTPTPTITPTPSLTPVPTETPTTTPTPTETPTPTPSSPFEYTIQEGDYLALVVERFNLGEDGIPLLLLLNPQIDPATQIVFVGQVITVPNPDLLLPTPTSIPADLRRGTELFYTVRFGDSLKSIAETFNSTVEDIQKLNEIVDINAIYVGQYLKIRANLVTPVPSKTPVPGTATPTP